MANLSKIKTMLDWFKNFITETLTTFGLVTILGAAMVPPTLPEGEKKGRKKGDKYI